MSIEEVLEALRESGDRRESAAEWLEAEHAKILGEDAEAAIRNLFATTNYLLRTQNEDYRVLTALVQHLIGSDEPPDVPHLRLVTDDD